ncbi:hypothetical protein EJ110_NYTH14058 [Nymphaea thermarum]|nr:hypothetical protein EJ110_NYTH14058 [Nymphaea thermarum]
MYGQYAVHDGSPSSRGTGDPILVGGGGDGHRGPLAQQGHLLMEEVAESEPMGLGGAGDAEVGKGEGASSANRANGKS